MLRAFHDNFPAVRDVSSLWTEWCSKIVRTNKVRITKSDIARLKKKVIAYWMKKYRGRKPLARKRQGHAMKVKRAA